MARCSGVLPSRFWWVSYRAESTYHQEGRHTHTIRGIEAGLGRALGRVEEEIDEAR